MQKYGFMTGVIALWFVVTANAAEETTLAPGENIYDTIASLDSATFDAFNHCDAPGQLEKHASFFDKAVEFYHDTGGVTWSRDEMIANTQKYVCGHFTRELIPGSLKVSAVKDFGAIETGSHRFCQQDSGKCDGLADFAIVWHKDNGNWQITRVLSYGHRTNAQDAQN